jgi:dihydrofolate reductase
MGMRRIFTTMHVTIDGKTVRPDGTIDWVSEGPAVYDFEAFDRADACVLGRVMYPEYEEYWRGVVAGTSADDTPDAKRYAEFADRTPHYVLGRTATEFDWPVARPVHKINEIDALRDQPGRDIYVVGGAITVRSFINAGLLDELRLTVHPLLVGDGISLFEGVEGDHRYDVTDTRRLADGSTRLVYQARVS